MVPGYEYGRDGRGEGMVRRGGAGEGEEKVEAVDVVRVPAVLDVSAAAPAFPAQNELTPDGLHSPLPSPASLPARPSRPHQLLPYLSTGSQSATPCGHTHP